MSIYPQHIAAKQKANPWAYYVLRPIALRIAPILAKPEWITANRMTWTGLIVGLLGCVALSSGWYWLAIVGTVLLNVRLLIDNLDGTIARIRKTVSLHGEWLDGFVDYTLYIVIPVAVGIGLFMGLEGYLNLPSVWYIVLGMFYALTKALRAVLTSYHKSLFRETMAARLRPNILGTAILFSDVQVLLVFTVLRLLDIYLICYSIIAITSIGVIMWKTLRA